MKIFQTVILVLLILLSFSAGIAKVLQVPDDVKFFQNAGLNLNLLMLLGVFQLASGILLIFQKTRIWGAIVLAVTLLISTIVIFINGQMLFGIISLLPIILVVIVVRKELEVKKVPISK